VACPEPEGLTTADRLCRVDESHQDETYGEYDKGGEVGLRLLAADGDALGALELSDGLLDPVATAVESAGEPIGERNGVGLVQDDRDGTASAGCAAVRAATIALVGDDAAGRGVRPEALKSFEHRHVGLLAPVISNAMGWPSKSVFR
jgi:hypothetical protein